MIESYLITVEFHKYGEETFSREYHFEIPPVVGDYLSIGAGRFKVTEREIAIGTNPIISAKLKAEYQND